MATPIALHNTSNNVTIAVKNCDNFLQIYLNPDSTNILGMAKVFGADGAGMPTAPNATLPLHNYLTSFKTLNPTVKSIVMVVCSGNYAGGGEIGYTITGPGVTISAINHNLATFTSLMDSYQINIF